MLKISNKKNQCIIYLDQFASVGIFESELSAWKRIKELIITGVEKKKIICPLSTEHYVESAQKEVSKAIFLDKGFYQLSGGFAFKSELFITSQLIISLIRKNNITLSTFFYDNINENVLADKKKLETLIELNNQFNEKIIESTQFVNEIRKITRVKDRTDLLTKQKLINTLKSITVSEFISRLNDLFSEGHIFIRGVSFKSGDVPHWIDQVIFQLTKKHKISKRETESLISEFIKHGFENIPTLDIMTSLSAIISVNNKHETANDHIDIRRISTGLPISDVLLTDKQRKNEILELSLNIKYGTKIYCGTKHDLEEFINDLEKINMSVN